MTSAEQLEYANKDLAIIATARDALDIDHPPLFTHAVISLHLHVDPRLYDGLYYGRSKADARNQM